MSEREAWLIEILLPLAYNSGTRIPDAVLDQLRGELAQRFGGLTAFTRSPAEGVWIAGATPHADDIVVLEIMADFLDRDWWAAWRRRTEALLRQEEIVVRAQTIERL